mmetsp:Transcript_21698/g.29815  ORF Transcript_21698/g.29815 Transcript_21698/m.29815 type:complete len:180 (+) Transcript_21698:73-612(+)|eukprot:CAMPEP_0201487460 /NCGR_PEP_ID=MMETSP0151_2-20130828/13381_1 /ASSEMBLY_ACC=CAM_ASM_000257 /TAXON_ID=200890 /ORGANISM="Paramoeba atlantica, Strain 621/1 / CCAP 1560/9" /LENGTH=179 /DNA_ID=CAMNT_0047872501 /DNA_START=52 /DNA_END=591 /DNA_ORIENTATION=+
MARHLLLAFVFLVGVVFTPTSARFMDWVNPYCATWDDCRNALLQCTFNFENYIDLASDSGMDLGDCPLYLTCPPGYALQWDPFLSTDDKCFLSGLVHNEFSIFDPPDFGLVPVVNPFTGLGDCLERADITGEYIDTSTYTLHIVGSGLTQGFQMVNWPQSCFQPYWDTYRQVMNRVGAI